MGSLLLQGGSSSGRPQVRQVDGVDRQRCAPECHSCCIAFARYAGGSSIFRSIARSEHWSRAFGGRCEHRGALSGLRLLVFADIMKKEPLPQITEANTGWRWQFRCRGRRILLPCG